MIRLLDELTDLEKLTLIPMSYSRLNTYDMCEAMYFYSYVLKEPGLFGEAAKMGNVIHGVLEEMVVAHKPVSGWQTEEYYSEFEVQLEKYDPDGIITEKYLDIGIDILQDWIDKHHGEQFQVLEKELAFEIVIGPALFRGFIDRVDVTNNITYITDYKTGAREVTYKDVHKNLQLGIYALAMDKLFPERDIHAELYYLKSGRRKGHLFTRDDLTAIESRVLGLVSEVINKRHFKETANARICSFCDHARSGACRTGARRLR